jgi:hypothetical protein
MSKPRRKQDIRDAMTHEIARLEAFSQTRTARARRAAPWHASFLASLCENKSVRAAAKKCGISFSGVYYARKTDPVFRMEWDRIIAAAKTSPFSWPRNVGAPIDRWIKPSQEPQNPTTAERQNGTVQRQNDTPWGDELDLSKLDAFTRKYYEQRLHKDTFRDKKIIVRCENA